MTTEIKPWEYDLFERSKYAEFLTNFICGPNVGKVMNLDASWGAGKTFFIKNWQAQLANEIHPTLYINAWETDYASDPLVPILNGLNSRLDVLINDDRIKKTAIRDVSNKLARGFKNGLPVILDALAVKLTGKENMGQFIQALTEGVSEGNTNLLDEFKEREELLIRFRGLLDEALEIIFEKFNSPFFIFIDELDRCRPNYAIEVLESVKHVFDFEGVVFVVATDKSQLVHSICSVYGDGFDAESYLTRFFDHQVNLPAPNNYQFAEYLFNSHSEVFEQFSYFPDFGMDKLKVVFAGFADMFNLQLRDQERCMGKLVSVMLQQQKKKHVHFAYLCFLVILNFKHHEEFNKILNEDFDENHNAIRNLLDASSLEILGIKISRYISLYIRYAIAEREAVVRVLRGMNAFNRKPEETLIEQIEHQHQELNQYSLQVKLSGYVDGQDD